MKRTRGRRLVLLLAVALVSAVAAGAALAGGTAGHKTVTVKLVTTADFGKVLATSRGLTLYHYTDEIRGKVDCKGACAKLWPPLLVKAGTKPSAGVGLTASKLGTLRRPDGGTQVTYNGWPLYFFAGDSAPGDTNGEGQGGVWYVLDPTGNPIDND